MHADLNTQDACGADDSDGIRRLDTAEIAAVGGGGFRLATGGQSWSANVQNLGYINGTINYFNLSVPMINWG